MSKLKIHPTLLLLTGMAIACSNSSDTSLFENSNPFPSQKSAVYGGVENWLCRPDLPPTDDACATNLDATIVNADGSTSIEKHVVAANPAVDCFYVYPTVSSDDAGNSNPFLAADTVFFGRPDTDDGTEAICTNPTALSGGAAPLDGYFATGSTPALTAVIINNAPGGPFADPAARSSITTPFYKMPGFLRGECKTSATGVNYLEVTALPDPDDPRADSFNGEFLGGDGWGLHLVDMTISMGNLLDLAESQAASWLTQN